MKETTGKPILDALINASESFATPTPERAAQPQSRGEHTADLLEENKRLREEIKRLRHQPLPDDGTMTPNREIWRMS